MISFEIMRFYGFLTIQKMRVRPKFNFNSIRFSNLSLLQKAVLT